MLAPNSCLIWLLTSQLAFLFRDNKRSETPGQSIPASLTIKKHIVSSSYADSPQGHLRCAICESVSCRRDMAAAGFFVAAVLLLLSSALAQTTQHIDKVVPTLDKVQSSLTIGPGVGVTPSSPSKRRRELLGSTSLFGKIALYDDDLLGLVSGRKERRMQQVNGYQVFGEPAQLSPEFSQQVLGPLTGNGTTSGSRRHLLQATTQLTFYGTIKQGLVTDRAIANYVFNQDSLPFLKVATQSGTTFTFLKALLILPQEQTATNVPPYVTSTTGFVPKDLAHPTIVRLNTQGPTSYAPQVALRFDYSQTVGSPLISLYYTDRVGTADQGGLPLANLNQTFNLDLAASHP